MSKARCSCSEESTRNLFINLKVIGKLDADQKLNTKDKYICLDDSTWYQWMIRKYRGDSRDNSISKLNKIIEETKKIIDDALINISSSEKHRRYLNLNAIEFLQEFHKLLREVESGLVNLRDTYNYDTTTSSQLDMNLITIRKYIQEIENPKNVNGNYKN